MALTGFSEITDRIVAIIDANRVTLRAGLSEPNAEMPVLGQFPAPIYNRYAVFVWLDTLQALSYGSIGGSGVTWTGEIDGEATWHVTAQIAVPADETTALADAQALAWNLLTILTGYVQEATAPKWGAMVVTAARNVAYQSENGQILRAVEIDLRIAWSREQ